VISGIGGEKQYADRFYEWGVAMADAAVRKFGVPEANVILLAEDPARDATRIDGKSTREEVEKALEGLAARLGAEDQLLVVLFGHGSQQGPEPRFNLPGRDMNAADFARLLSPVQARVAFVNTASASGEFIKPISGERRTVVTATKSGFERNQTMFGKYFVDAFAGDGADADKDGRISVLEAFDFARREVARAYEADNRLLTEHALLDDNGDGVGSADLKPPSTDGGNARGFYLAAGAAARAADAALAGAAADPRTAALAAEKRKLEERIEALKRRKAQMAAADYERELEGLLVELATTSAALRKATEGKP
jgi:hypothetical protein